MEGLCRMVDGCRDCVELCRDVGTVSDERMDIGLSDVGSM